MTGRGASRARFAVTAFPADRMRSIGDALVSSIQARLARGLTTEDAPAPPLREKYARYKQRKGGQPIRDWKRTGRTLRALGVTSATNNKAVVGFSDPVAAMRAAMQNRRIRQFGVSANDSANIAPLFKNFIEVRKG
jgi:phage gpG-like protein